MIVIGTPVYEREWILNEWYQSIIDQDYQGDITLIFGLSSGEDETEEIIDEMAFKFDTVCLNCDDLPKFKDRASGRFEVLAKIRNRILCEVRDLKPDFFLSWDTDIILPPDSLRKLIEADKDMIGPWVGLSPKGDIPNCGHWDERGQIFRRKLPITTEYPQQGLTQVDTVFACSLMKPVVYNSCYYGYHRGGEDYFFGLEMMRRGLESWLCGDIVGIHHYNKR
jgi:hypothetical protein